MREGHLKSFLGGWLWRLALLIFVVVLPGAEVRAARGACPDPVTNPGDYLQVCWSGQGDCTDMEAALPVGEVIGNRGQLWVHLDTALMKRCWDFDTEGSFSLSGFKLVADTGTKEQIGIPGYSEFGEKRKVVPLNLSAAFDVVMQLTQGIRLADRVLEAKGAADLARLEGEVGALAKLVAAEKKLVDEIERALREVYTEALRFELDERHITRAAEAIAEARSARKAVVAPSAVGEAQALETFFRKIEAQRGSIEAWLDKLLADGNEPYWNSIAQIAGRNQSLIEAVGAEVRRLMEKLAEGGLDQSGRQAAMDRLVAVARKLKAMERAVTLRYQQATPELVQYLEGAVNYSFRAPRNMTFAEIQPSSERIQGCKEGLSAIRLVQSTVGGEARFEFEVEPATGIEAGSRGTLPPAGSALSTVDNKAEVLWSRLRSGVYRVRQIQPSGWQAVGASCSDGSVPEHLVLEAGETVTCTFVSRKTGSKAPDPAAKRADERIAVLRALLEDVMGSSQYKSRKQEIRDRFQTQIATALSVVEKRQKELAAKRAHVRQAKETRAITRAAIEECRDELISQAQLIEYALMKQVQDSLIDRVQPVALNLDELGLKAGDRLNLDVSLRPPAAPGEVPPRQQSWTYLVVPWGWSGTVPQVTDSALTFVRADSGGGDFAPRAGISALWNYYGKQTRRNSRWRWLAPGFGLNVTFLDSDDDENTIEVGVGATVTLFNNIVQLTWGRNLSSEFEFESADPTAEPVRTRGYFGFGISLTEVVSEFNKKKDKQ